MKNSFAISALSLLETERLTLRPFRLDDAIAAHAWFGDPLVMKYTPAGPDRSLEKTHERLVGYGAHQRRHGFSKWLVIERASGQPVGDAGLMVLEREGWIDLGFRFEQRSWGKGFATEVGAAWVSAAFGDLALDELGAFVHPENVASLRVLEKLGFRRNGRNIALGMPAICFTLQRPALAFDGPPAVKDQDTAHPVAGAWRAMLRQVVRRFVEGDYGLVQGVAGVEPVSAATAEHVRAYLANYGATLVQLPDETWQTSVAQWMGRRWEILVDLWTVEEGRSDLVLGGWVEETDTGFRFTVHMVYVP